MVADPKARPAYAVRSVDHALRLAAMLQLEGELTVSQAAERLEVAPSTAHRLLAMLVYRDFAVQDESRVYRAGPVLELAAHSQSLASRLRSAALPHLQRLVGELDESANLIVRAGDTARFIASVESRRPLRVTTREGMVFPAHKVTGGLLLLAELAPAELDALYGEQAATLRRQLARIRRNGFAVNDGLSERGVVAVGVPVRDRAGTAVAGLSISVPGARYDKGTLPAYVVRLAGVAQAMSEDLAAS